MTYSTDTTEFLRILQPEGVREIRAPKCPVRRGTTFTGTASGYFDAEHLVEASAAVEALGRCEPPGIYVTLNPVRPDLLARAANRIRPKSHETSADVDVLARRWLLVDIDPVRPAGISADNGEVARAVAAADAIEADRAAAGWPAPLRVFSGNGMYLLYRVDLPNDEPATALVKACLQALAKLHGSAEVSIDRSTFNAARILKVAGTWARKGDSVPDRPHRQSYWTPPRSPLEVVPTELLEALADSTLPSAPSSPTPAPSASPTGDFEQFEHTVAGVATYLQNRGVEIKDIRADRIILERCPITGADGGTSVAVLVTAEGKISYCNLHNRGTGLEWVDLRDHLEPGYKAHRDSFRDGPVLDPGVDLSGFSCSPQAEPPKPASPPPACEEFPPHLLEVPGFVAEVMAYNLATAPRPQPVLALAGALCLQAVLAARKVRDERGNRTNLYCVGVAESGCGKEHARQVNKRILAAADAINLEAPEDIASDAGLIAAIKAQPALLFQIDEFGRFLKAAADPRAMPHLYAALGALMRLYSAAASSFRGKAYADKDRNQIIDQPCVSLYGTSVPTNFFGSLTAEGLEDGFVARMLAFEGTSSPDRCRPVFTDPPKSVVAGAVWWAKFRPPGAGNLHQTNAQPMVVRSTPEAVAIFDSLAEHIDQQRRVASTEAKSLWARAEEKACRLALTYACSANTLGKPVIDAAAAMWACELSEWLTRRLVELADQYVYEGQFDQRQKRILRAVRAAGGTMTAAELAVATRRITPRERVEAVGNLIATGQLVEQVEQGSTKPKRSYAIPNLTAR